MVVFVIDQLELFVNNISFLVLPFSVDILDPFHKDSGTIFVIEVILFKREHFGRVLPVRIPSFEILFAVVQIFDIFVVYVGSVASLFYNV